MANGCTAVGHHIAWSMNTQATVISCIVDLDIEESKCEQVVGEKDNLLSESKSFKLQILKEGRPQKAHKI